MTNKSDAISAVIAGEDLTKSASIRALDILATALADHGHVWSDDERRAYEGAVSLLTASDDCTETGSSA